MHQDGWLSNHTTRASTHRENVNFAPFVLAMPCQLLSRDVKRETRAIRKGEMAKLYYFRNGNKYSTEMSTPLNRPVPSKNKVDLF